MAKAKNGKEEGETTTPDVYQFITDRIITLLESGTIPWRVPWKAARQVPQNLITKRSYRGINAFLLHCMGYASAFWLTLKQAQSLGGKVRRGGKACPVVFWKWLEIVEVREMKRILPRYCFSSCSTTKLLGCIGPSRQSHTISTNGLDGFDKLLTVALGRSCDMIHRRCTVSTPQP